MTPLKQIFYKSRHIVLYGAFLTIMVLSLKWVQWKYLITDNAIDIYTGIIAATFTVLGIGLALRLAKEKKTEGLHSVEFSTELEHVNLTTREHEVLKLLILGLSNAEIADKLFLSVSTVKTYVSTLFVKMGVKTRTQALEKASRLKITGP